MTTDTVEEQAETQNKVDKNLYYGVALYEYFQGDQLAALTELSAASEQGRLDNLTARARILQGSMLLAYGLDEQAQTEFDLLLADAGVDESFQDLVWFYLAKLYVQRGEKQAALENLRKIKQPLQNELSGANDYLGLLAGDVRVPGDVIDSPWHAYLFYNLGLIAFQKDSHEQALDYLTQALDITQSADFSQQDEMSFMLDGPGAEAEQGALMERIQLSRAQILRKQNKLDDALTVFKSLPLGGFWSNLGLLEYGWTALENRQQERALTAWQHLSQQPLLLPEVQQVLLAKGYVLETMFKPDQAIIVYQNARKQLSQTLQVLLGIKEGLTEDNLFKRILGKPLDRDGFLAQQSRQLHSPDYQLALILSDEKIQSTYSDMLDLMLIQKHTESWHEKTQHFEQLLALRKTARETEVAKARQYQNNSPLTQMIAQRDELAQSIADKSNWIKFASPEMKKKWKVLEESLGRIEGIKGHKKYNKLKQRLLHAKALLTWQLAEEHSQQHWLHKKELMLLDRELAVAQGLRNKLDDAIEHPKQIEALNNRTIQSRQALDLLRSNVDKALTRGKAELFIKVSGLLDVQIKRLQQLSSESQVAITRIQEKRWQGAN